jgi:hypothetical protein
LQKLLAKYDRIKSGTFFRLIEITFKIKNNCMPQKHHDKAAQHNEEAAKHHKTASKHASEGNHEKAAHHAQAAQGHQQKANEHSARASEKYAQKAGTMKKEDMEDDDNMQEQDSENGRGKSGKK